MREYGVHLLDFYRGTVSSRRLVILIRYLSADSALVRALNGGPMWSNTDHRIADLWALFAKKDHPIRAEMEAKAKKQKKQARVIELRTVFEKRKRTYGLG